MKHDHLFFIQSALESIKLACELKHTLADKEATDTIINFLMDAALEEAKKLGKPESCCECKYCCNTAE